MTNVKSNDNLLFLSAVAVLISGLIVAGIFKNTPLRLASQAAADKVLICHVPPGKPAAAVAISISIKAWETGHEPHAAHALDYLIEEGTPCPPVDGE